MWARLRERAVNVGGGEKPAVAVLLSRAGATMVSAAVDALMMHAGDAPGFGQRRRPREDPLGLVGVQPHAFPLRAAQATGTLPYPGWHGSAPKVVQQRGAAQRRDRLLRLPPKAGRALSDPCHAARVTVEMRRLQIPDHRECNSHVVQTRLRRLERRAGLRCQQCRQWILDVQCVPESAATARIVATTSGSNACPAQRRRIDSASAAPSDCSNITSAEAAAAMRALR